MLPYFAQTGLLDGCERLSVNPFQAVTPLPWYFQPRQVEGRRVFVVEPTASEEKLRQLLAEGHESSALDYKATLDLAQHHDVVELAKDLAALRGEPLGGYVVVGAADDGSETDGLSDDRKASLFDEAALRGKVQKFLTEPLQLLSGVHIVDGHRYACVYVGPVRRGFEVFRVEGAHDKTIFRAGDVFVRRGTASTRWNGTDADERLQRHAQQSREEWRREIREDLREIFSAGEAGQRVARGPAGAYTWQLDPDTFAAATLELLRAGDDIPLRRFLLQAPGELSRLRADSRDADLDVVLDRVTCLAALAVEVSRDTWVNAATRALTQAYELGMDSSGVSHPEDRRNIALWLGILSRAYGLGGLAVRLEMWSAVRTLAAARPSGHDFESYWQSWLRHAQVNASRANALDAKTGVLATANNDVRRIECLRPDVAEEDERVLTSLCQFDVLAAVSVAAARRRIDSSTYYTNFAIYWPRRTLPAIRRLISDETVRNALAPELSDASLAVVLSVVLTTASREGNMLGGWHGTEDEVLSEFLRHSLPADFSTERHEWDLT